MSTNKTGTINVKLEIEETSPLYIGLQGCPGPQGYQGYGGSPGSLGSQGNVGPIGPQGLQGNAGPLGATGETGNTGLTGPAGPLGQVGASRTWWISGETGGCTPFDPNLSGTGLVDCTGDVGNLPVLNQIGRQPIAGDLLLNLDNCGICEYSDVTNQFEPTSIILKPCIKTTDLEKCLTNIQSDPDQCTFTLTLTNCPPLFGGLGQPEPHKVQSITIFGVPQTVPSGTFTTPEELANLLDLVGWQSTSAFGTTIYLTSLSIDVPPYDPTKKSEIVFCTANTNKLFTRTIDHHCDSELCYACDQFNAPQAQRYLLSLPTGPSGLAWVSPECLSVTGLTGYQGLTGLQGLLGQSGQQGPPGLTGPIGPSYNEICDCLTSLETKYPLSDCIYQGIIQPSCLNFLNSLDDTPVGNKIYYVATGLTNPPSVFEFVLGPADFRTKTESIIILAAMDIIIQDGLVQVNGSPDTINRVVFLNANQELLHEIYLDPTSCCPQIRTPKESPILTKSEIFESSGCVPSFAQQCPTGGCTGLTGLAMIPAECVLQADFDLPTEICLLPPIQPYRCCLEISATDLFVETSWSPINPSLPWRVLEIILFDRDFTSAYNNKPITTYKDWTDLLEMNNWKQTDPTGALTHYQFCLSSNESLEKTTNKLTIVDKNGSIVYCKSQLAKPQCQQTDMKNIRLIVKDNGFTGLTGYAGCEGLTGLPTGIEGSTGYTLTSPTGGIPKVITGVKLAPPAKLLDAIPPCPDVCYICSVIVDTKQLINTIKIGSPWNITDLVLAGNTQSPPVTGFSSALQFQTILLILGWNQPDPINSPDVYSQTIIQPLPNFSSYMKIGNGAGKSQTINLETNCTADCRNITDADRRYIFTRLDEGQFCWMHPNCFNDPMLNLECCPTGTTLKSLPDCGITSKYDLRLEITGSTINLIKKHYNSTGPFWINGYKVRVPNPDWNPEDPVGGLEPKWLSEIRPLDQIILTPFSLRTLVESLEVLGWISDIEPINIISSTLKINLVLNNSEDIILGVCLNLFGETGQYPKNGDPVNYIIPLNTIDRVECHDLPRDAMILLKDAMIPGFTGTICPLPTGPTSSTACTGICWVDLDCVVPTVPQTEPLEQQMLGLDECVTCCTGVSTSIGLTGCETCFETTTLATGLDTITVTGLCEFQAYYENRVIVSGCDVDIINRNFGGTGPNLQIQEYVSINGRRCILETPIDLGSNIITLTELVDGLIALGWVTEDPLADQVELTLLTCQNIHYIVINGEGADPSLPPYAYYLSASGIISNYCPSTNRANKVLIQKPSDCCDVCWTQICQIPGLMGAQGGVGLTGMTGMTGPPGPGGNTGPKGIVGMQGPTGDQGIETGPRGRTGVIGPLGPIITGSTGPRGPAGAPGDPAPPGSTGGSPGPTGPPGDEGAMGPQGETGATNLTPGASNFTPGPPGTQGPSPQGAQGASIGTSMGLNLGGEGTGLANIFKEVGPPNVTFYFRTLIDGKNIVFNVSPNEIDISVDTDFDWGITQFFGGGNASANDAAEVDNASSLTFQSGATLFTDIIEDRDPSDNGTVIDTSAGNGVLFLEGGVEFQNDMFNTTLGPTVRPTFLELFEFGSFTTGFQFAAAGGDPAKAIPGTVEIAYQRIGNVVTVFIPTITGTPINGPGVGGTSVIESTTSMPEIIRSTFNQIFHITYDSDSGGAGVFAQTMIRFAGPAINIHGPAGSLNNKNAGEGWLDIDYFSNNRPTAYTYQISTLSGDYCPPFV